MRTCWMFLTVLSLALPAPAADNWPAWRGPNRDGTTDSTGLPVEWDEQKNVKWKAPLPCWGGASPIVYGDRVFVVSPSAGSAGKGVSRKLPMAGRSNPGGDDILLLCLSREDGSVRWQRSLDDGNTLFGKQNMASPSPVTDGEHVWVATGTGVIAAFQVSGEEVWRRDLQKEYGEFGLYWGYASSPMLHDDKLFVQVLHGATTDDPSYLLALDSRTGKNVWKRERVTGATKECPDAYTTPTILRHDDQDQLIISGADYVTAHEPATGKELWRCGGLNPLNMGNYRIVGTPIAMSGMIYAPTRNKPLLAIRAGGSGDVSESHVAWKYEGPGGPDVPSPVCDGKYLYLVDDAGIVNCLDARTGSVVWGPKRTAIGTVSASPVLADGKLFVTNEQGTTTVLAAGPEFKEIATNELNDEYTISTPAIAGSQIFIRTSKFLYCIE